MKYIQITGNIYNQNSDNQHFTEGLSLYKHERIKIRVTSTLFAIQH